MSSSDAAVAKAAGADQGGKSAAVRMIATGAALAAAAAVGFYLVYQFTPVSYTHLLFAADGFRRAFLAGLSARFEAGPAFEPLIEATLDALADHLEAHLAIDRMIEIAHRR